MFFKSMAHICGNTKLPKVNSQSLHIAKDIQYFSKQFFKQYAQAGT